MDINRILEGLNGGLMVGTGMLQGATIKNNPYYDSQINQLRNAGNYNFSNYEQLANEYAQTDFTPRFSYDEIRGMSKADKWGTVGTSALTGGLAGWEVGGPIGAAIGGIGAGLLQWGANGIGDELADISLNTKKTQAAIAADAAQQNFMAGHERLADRTDRLNYSRIRGEGGSIERKQQSIKEFADRVLKTQRRSWNNSTDIVRTHKDGGTCIRIKVK